MKNFMLNLNIIIDLKSEQTYKRPRSANIVSCTCYGCVIIKAKNIYYITYTLFVTYVRDYLNPLKVNGIKLQST